MAEKGSLLHLPAEKPLLSRAIFFVLGAFYTASFAPLGLSLILPFTLLPLLYVCLTVSTRDAAAHGFWFGLGLYLTGTYWIYISVVVFGQAPAWIALLCMFVLVVVMAICTAISAWLISRFSHGESWLLLLVAPSAWVLLEWLRGWIFTGFPWLALGYSQIDTPLAGWAPILGVYGVSFMLMLSASAILVVLLATDRQRYVALAMVFAPWVLGGILKYSEWTEPQGEALKTTLLQAGIPQDQKWLREMKQPTLDFYKGGTALASDSDIVVWPEVAIPSWTSLEEPFIARLQSETVATGQTVLFGILEHEQDRGESRLFNSVVLVDSSKRQSYRKRHLVPFGEYFPVPATVREWMRMMSLPHSDLAAGAEIQELLATADGTKLAVAICYEDAYGVEQLYALPDAGLLVNVSNDAWFGDSIAPHQHLEISRMRSLEVGRDAVRATNTGISAFIDHRGKLIDRGEQFVPVSLTANLQPRSGSTPYASTGNIPIIGLCILIVGGLWARSRI